MSKMLKAVAMLLIIAAVVFAAGCANKEAPAAENKAPAHAEETNKSVISSAENNTTAGMPAEANASVVLTNTTVTNSTDNVTENITASNTSAPAENATENVTK